MNKTSTRTIETGQRHGKWLVIEKATQQKTQARWKCRCDCGTEKDVFAVNLSRNLTKSCGCGLRTRGGLSKHPKYTPLYQAWKHMIRRCTDPQDVQYPDYGGRGVQICEEWLKGPEEFTQWALDNGWKKGMHIDKDMKGDGKLYSPATCSIVTPLQNARKKRNVLPITINGETKASTEWSEIYGVSARAIRDRYHNGIEGLDLVRKGRVRRPTNGK